MVLSATSIQVKRKSLGQGALDDPDFVRRVRDRDPESLRLLFSHMNTGMMRMLAAQGIFSDSAEELVHESWETFFTNLEKFEERSSIKTFIFGILLNKIRENRRRMNRVELEEDSEKIFDRSFTSDGWWDKQPDSPDKLLANKQLSRAIKECLEGLSESQRNAFLLIESAGEDSQSACKMMAISISNLRVLIFRAKEKLKICLEGSSAIS